jgi:hypothetical protein
VPGDLPVTGARVIPGAGLVLLSVEEAAGLGLKLFDLKTRRFIPIQFASPTGFLQLGEVESGKLSGEPVAVVADGNRLRVFAFKPQGNPPQQFRAEARLTLPGVMSAAWVEADGDGSRLWVGDEGGPGGGGLTRLDGKDMKVLQADGTPGLFPVAGDFKAGGPEGIALYLSVDTAALPMESKLGAIGLTGGGDPEVATVARSGPVLGLKAPQGELRPLGIAAVVYHGRLQIGVALSRVKGALGGSGLGLWYKPVGQGAGQFLAGDLGKAMELIPFQDARDVVFTADGKGAFLAGGVAGVVGMDVEQKKPVSRMSLGTQDWLADRVLLSHGGKIVLASFLHKASGQVIVKIFGVGEGLQMEELGTITGLKAVATAAGLRAPHVAVTGDDRYVLVPVQSDLLTVMDLSQPSQPLEVTSLKVPAEIHGISVAGESPADGSLEIYLALGPAGVAKYKFSPKRP